MAKLKVGLLFGGNSGEHEVSIASAKAILSAFQEGENLTKYEVKPFYIDKKGIWQNIKISEKVLTNGEVYNSNNEENKWQFPPEVQEIDVWFPIIHGPNGEDGTIQGLLTLMQIPFVGSGVLGSAMGMDKIAMKNIFAQAGLPQVKYMAVTRAQIWSNPCIFPKLGDEIEEKLGYPCFIKPANLGSSVGISKAKNRSELENALDEAAQYDTRIIVEAGVTAREVECAVLGNDHPQASVIGEITFDADFYDYETKYTDGKSQMIIPAQLPPNIVTTIQEMAIKAFTTLNCAGLSRVDFFYEESSGEIYINEVNTLPGFTKFSMYPQLWVNTGIAFPDLVDKLIQLALEKK